MNIPPLKVCPWCGATPVIEKEPLWNESHGYHGSYRYYITCKNKKCNIQPRTKEYNTIYGKTEETCINNATRDWNWRK